MSLRGFAKAIGVSEAAIRKGAKAGRFGEEFGRDEHGQPCILDAAIAAEKWKLTTRNGAGATGRAPVKRSDSSRSARTGDAVTLVDAQRSATNERARKLRLENDKQEGRLVAVEKVKREAFESARLIRESMLNIPARLSGELAAETDAAGVFRRLDAAIREALTGVADGLDVTAH